MAIGTATALLASAVIGAGASAISSNKAVNSAAKTSQQATDASIEMQNKALDTQQANTKVIREAGDTATTALLDRLGLNPAAKEAAAATENASRYSQYLKQNPDVAAAWEANKSDPKFGGDINAFAADHYKTFGQKEGRALPNPEPSAVQPPAAEPARPGLVQTPAYQAPTLTQTPAYEAPDVGNLDVSLGSYEKAPDYEFQQSEARRGTLAGAAATGALRSGAAAKALQDRAQQIAYGDYTNWRNYTTGQYNTDRSRADQNAQFGYNALTDQNRFKDSAAIDASTFGYNALTNQNSQANQYNQQNFNTDRAYTADQKQQGTNNLFTLSGLGASATGANNNAIANTASNNSNALFSNASAQGNAALAGAGQTNNAINTGVNALSYYYGNKAKSGAKTLPAWSEFDGA